MQSIFVLDVNDVAKEYARVRASLSDEAVKKAEERAEKKDVLRSLSGALLIRAFTANAQLLINEYGKPYKPLPPYFNISHSENSVGIFLSDDAEVGFDLQAIKAYDPKLTEYAFTEEERVYINRNDDFIRLWTMKEAAAKCAGTGFIRPKNHPITEITDGSLCFGGKKMHYKNYFEKDFIATACSYDKINAEISHLPIEFVFETLAKRQKNSI